MAYVQTKQWTLSVQTAPEGCELAHHTLFTPEALDFVGELIFTFSKQTQQLNEARKQRRSQLLQSKTLLPDFPRTSTARQSDWKIAPLPAKLMNRRIDVGDVSPTNVAHLCEALAADVQGVQVDFDDGHCPLWPNQIKGLHAVVQAVSGQLAGLNKPLDKLPILMLRPRAWNMIEHNAMLNGVKVPGPLFDFGLLIFHLGKILLNANNGPCFYLSKLEDSSEARLWNHIFVWAQKKLKIPQGSIKACVLIENILAAFQMEEILYELKEHSLGLNCGIWDYAASIIIKLGHRQEFVIPDRNLYVNVKQRFLSSYMALVVSTCHKHGAPATGGMAALLVPGKQNMQEVIDKVVMAKQWEVNIGLDGFLIYDLKLIPHLQKLWPMKNASSLPIVTATDLLAIPTGEITEAGLKHNIAVSVLFIYHWLQGQGHFSYKGAVEDSATAEISRSQVWQWVHHKACLDGSGEKIDARLIENLAQQFVHSWDGDKLIQIAASFFLEIVLTKSPPEFITSHLNDNRMFCTLAVQSCQAKHGPSAKL